MFVFLKHVLKKALVAERTNLELENESFPHTQGLHLANPSFMESNLLSWNYLNYTCYKLLTECAPYVMS